MFIKILTLGGFLPPVPGLYTCIHVRPLFYKIFLSETALPIKAKFHVALSWEEGWVICINDPGHMTKMVAMLIYLYMLNTFKILL